MGLKQIINDSHYAIDHGMKPHSVTPLLQAVISGLISRYESIVRDNDELRHVPYAELVTGQNGYAEMGGKMYVKAHTKIGGSTFVDNKVLEPDRVEEFLKRREELRQVAIQALPLLLHFDPIIPYSEKVTIDEIFS